MHEIKSFKREIKKKEGRKKNDEESSAKTRNKLKI
jgi:hypothetical protein